MKGRSINPGIWLALVTTVGLLQGCATLGPAYKEVSETPSDKSTVYIYRPSNFVGGGVSYYLYANDKIVTKLHNGSYYPYIAEPGTVEFWAQTESKSEVKLNLDAGKTYYLKGTVGMGIMVGRPHLMIVPENTAKLEITECNLIPDSNWEEEKINEENERREMLGI